MSGNYFIIDARKKFRQRVKAAERKLPDEKRREVIGICLNCQLPDEQCKGDCKILQTIKIKRGKNVI